MTREPRIVHDGRQGAARVAAFLHHVGPWLTGHFTILALTVLGLAVAARFVKLRPNRTGTAKAKLTARLRPILKYDDTATRFLEMPRNTKAAGAPIGIRYPARYHPTDVDITRIGALIAAHLGGTWTARNLPMQDRLIYTRDQLPNQLPTMFPYEDMTRRADLIPLGIRSNGDPVVFNLRGESPHALVSASSRKGKTTLLSVIAAHVAHHGGLVTIIDPKTAGFAAVFADLPNVRILTPGFGGKVPAMAEAIIGFKALIDARYVEIAAGRRTSRSYDNEVQILILDEMDMLTGLLTDHWKSGGGRGKPPALAALGNSLGLGAMARCHVVTAAQSPDVASLGGLSDGIRAAYDFKLALGKPSNAMVAKMFGPSAQLPDSGLNVRGRAVVQFDNDLEVVQLAWLDIEESGPGHVNDGAARRLAATGSARFADVANVANVAQETPENAGPCTSSEEMATEKATVPMVKEPASAPAPARTGRPSALGLSPVRLECRRCGREWETTKAGGESAKCPGCKASRRVPVAARMGG